ncbi:hypothetical protein HPB47_004390 [Ixodes persulcatus]|uniref:Uncharacterized protein n=1 Tax=Ixodes persulcatus TaxID=34615 RepID=A0AC60PFZ5_IXOPE|nr:hypothetical protein HPB47_004390 [Ixodes persulcatus]
MRGAIKRLRCSFRLGYFATEAHSWARGGASASAAAMTSLLWNAQTGEAAAERMAAAAPARQLCADCLPARMKAFHAVRQSYAFNILFGLVRPFMKKKLADRIHLHGLNFENLHKEIPPSILPEEYGGDVPSLDFDAFWTQMEAQERAIFWTGHESTKRRHRLVGHLDPFFGQYTCQRLACTFYAPACLRPTGLPEALKTTAATGSTNISGNQTLQSNNNCR